MFTTINPDRPASTPTKTAPHVTLINGTDDYFGSRITYLPSSGYDNLSQTAIALADITVDGSTISFDASDKNIAEIRLGNNSYTLAIDSSNPQPGEYVYDETAKTTTVYLVDGDSVERSAVIVVASSTTVVNKSTCIPVATEPLLARWNAKTGSINLVSNFEQEPEGWSFSFISCKTNESTVRAALDNGTIHACFGYQWVVDNLGIKDLKNDFGQIEVTVDLEYFLSDYGDPSKSPLDKTLKLQKKIGRNNYFKRRSLGEFATLAGVNYQGDNLSVRISRNISSTEYTTFRDLIVQRAINAHGFVFYGKNGIEIRKWGQQKTHIINESDLREEPRFDYLGQGNRFNGVRLGIEYRNQKINLDFEDGGENSEGVRQEWVFKNCDSLFEFGLASQKNANGVLISPSIDILRSPGINFDAGGTFGKQATKITRVNGTVTFEERRKNDYAFASEEVYNTVITAQGNIIIRPKTSIFPQTFFKEVHFSTSDWIYDADGYLDQIRVRGQELSRLQQETKDLESATAAARAEQKAVNGIPDPSERAIADAYKFTENLPITDTTKYFLSRHDDFYDDVTRPDTCDDDDFVDPKFARTMQRSQEDFFIQDNPKNTDAFTFPPVQTGKYYREEQRIIPTETDEIQKYEKRSFKQSGEGESFKNAIAVQENEYHDGKPPVHTRLNLDFDYQTTVKNNAYARFSNQNYYLYSSGVIDGDIKVNEGSIGFVDIDNPNDAKAIAETKLSIDNTRNSVTTTIDIHWRPNVETGDFVIFRNKRWVIFSKNDDRDIKEGFVNSTSFRLDLGMFLQPGLEMENRRFC